MFEKGNLLLFRPFVFKNGAMPKDKFFLVLENVDGNLLLASLPTSKDHVPSDVEVKHGCLDLAERFVNVFVFLSGEQGGRIKMRSPPKVLTGNFRPSQLSFFLS